MKIKILFEDDFLMVVNKPVGVVVTRVETERGETVEEWVTERNREEGIGKKGENRTDFSQRAGIVHRLDKETSGCLIIAKTEEAFVDLQRQFRERKVKKEYIALVHGRVEPKEGTVKVPIARSHHDSEKFAVVVGGRISETGYKVLNVFKGPALLFPQGRALSDFSLLRVFPKTGRTHQIRVHFKYFGHPLVSDEKYGGSIAVEDRKWCPRIFLHASKITFTHPINKSKIFIDSPLPKDLSGVVKNFKLSG